MTPIFRIVVFFLLIVSASSAFAATTDTLLHDSVEQTPLRIAHIYYNGNHVTKEYVIKLFTKLDTGMVFDSLKTRKAKQQLEATGLFLKVAVIPLIKKGAVDVYIIVKEPPYFGISALDLTPYTYRHGKSGTWYCPFIGLEHTNLRGRMETLRLSLRFWEWRTIALSWSKPLFPSPFFIGISAYADARPDNALPMDRMEFSGSITAGRRCFARSRIFISASPDYQRRISWTATERDTGEFYQAFGSIGWFTDHRSARYDPSKGWSFFFETRSNALYHQSPAYAQFSSDIKLYHRGFWESHKTVYHLSVTARTNDAGIQNRLVLGGLGSVRGYANNGIDLGITSSHSMCFSWEYRFPIYQFPSLSPIFPQSVLKTLGRFAGDLSDLAPRLDGGFIFDYGRIARYFDGLFLLNNRGYRSGTDFGFGLRIMEPSLRRSACMDIVWIENPLTEQMDFFATPSWRLYLDLSF